jgi:phosphatidate cytidylyltransferase
VLKQRLFTAALLIPLVVTGVLRLSTQQIAVLFAGVVALAAWEWAALAGLHAVFWRMGYVALVVAALSLVWMASDVPPVAVMLAALLCWLSGGVWVSRTDRALRVWPKWIRALAGMVVLVPAWWALVVLHQLPESGRHYVVFLLALIWTADTAAYLSGRLWGSRKLAPHISPGKTWEGVWGALAAGLLLGVFGARYFGLQGSRSLGFVALCTITVLFSIVGDLAESAFKRQSGLKDSGRLLPGHGGVLDRVDSLTAAAPLFMLGLWPLGLVN